MIAKENKHQNIDETFIKLCVFKAASLVLGKTYSKMAKISFSYSTIKRTIDELTKNIECQVSKNYKPTFFQLTCDETIDPVVSLHLLQLKKICCFADH